LGILSSFSHFTIFSGQVRRLRFNNFDRASIPPKDAELFYNSYTKLGKIIQDPALCYKTKLKQGTILLADNFRVMHGRTGFDGRRTVSGAYLRFLKFSVYNR